MVRLHRRIDVDVERQLGGAHLIGVVLAFLLGLRPQSEQQRPEQQTEHGDPQHHAIYARPHPIHLSTAPTGANPHRLPARKQVVLARLGLLHTPTVRTIIVRREQKTGCLGVRRRISLNATRRCRFAARSYSRSPRSRSPVGCTPNAPRTISPPESPRARAAAPPAPSPRTTRSTMAVRSTSAAKSSSCSPPAGWPSALAAWRCAPPNCRCSA